MHRAVFYTGCTARTLVLQNIPGLFSQRYGKVSNFTFNTVNFSIGEDLYIGMPVDLDQFGRKYSDGAVIGWEGLVKLGHMAANGRRLVDQVNLKAGIGKIKRGLNTADPSANNYDISKITVPKTPRELLDYFLRQYCIFHVLLPHYLISQISNSFPRSAWE